MIRVARVPPPETFDARCRQPGNAWLAQNPDSEEFPGFWRQFAPDLERAFHHRCAYLGIFITKGTVDHYLAKSRERALVYEWSNYRFADFAVNSGKKPAWDGHLIDPFEVEDDWFEVLLPSCQLRIVEERVPASLLERVRFTVSKLKLDHGEEVVGLRREWLHWYEQGELQLEGLRRLAPQVARAVERRQARSQ